MGFLEPDRSREGRDCKGTSGADSPLGAEAPATVEGAALREIRSRRTASISHRAALAMEYEEDASTAPGNVQRVTGSTLSCPLGVHSLAAKPCVQIDWGNQHEEEAASIADAGQRWVLEDLSMEHVYEYMLHLLKTYAELQVRREFESLRLLGVTYSDGRVTPIAKLVEELSGSARYEAQ